MTVWPQLDIASPYFDLANTGFSICQPVNEQECISTNANDNWTWWSNPIFNDCRINPTDIEMCIDLPNLHYNGIIASFWNDGCYIEYQKGYPKEDDGNGDNLEKRGIRWGWSPCRSPRLTWGLGVRAYGGFSR